MSSPAIAHRGVVPHQSAGARGVVGAQRQLGEAPAVGERVAASASRTSATTRWAIARLVTPRPTSTGASSGVGRPRHTRQRPAGTPPVLAVGEDLARRAAAVSGPAAEILAASAANARTVSASSAPSPSAAIVTSVPHLAQRAWLNGDERAGRAASHQVSWELHRAGEILRQVAAALDRAPEVEAQIALDHPRLPAPARADPLNSKPRLSL